MRRFLITDTHWNHSRIVQYCNRPVNFKDLIIKNWRSIVKDNDIVYHLGDVIFYNVEELSSILGCLPGKKILIKGNHDKQSDTWYMANGFDMVCDALMINKILLSHAPMELTKNIDYNIHGHFHNSPLENCEYKYRSMYNKSKHILLSIEHENYKPVTLDQIIANKKKLVN